MKVFGLIGFPLEHSQSPAFFRELFLKEKITGHAYTMFPLPDIRDFIPLLKKEPRLAGLNVTIPHKTAILPCLDELDITAAQTGAVNTIKIFRSGRQIRTKGYNTDITGFRKSLTSHLLPHHNKAVVLGTGGASRAVVHVLRELSIDYTLVSRKADGPGTMSYEKLLSSCLPPLIIHCSPLGMFPLVNSSPLIPFSDLSSDNLVFDLIYNPSESLLLRKAREMGAQICNGLEMLHNQAEAAWEIWNDDNI